MAKRRVSSINEVVAAYQYLRRIGAELRTFRTAVVKEKRGTYWKDVGIIRFKHDGSIDAPPLYAPTKEEKALIEAELQTVEFPHNVPLDSCAGPDIPAMIREAPPEHVFHFRDANNKIVMVQVRIELPDGGKKYVPWTYWDDGVWRQAEPEGPLPLFGLETIQDHTTVFIHEGAKAAAIVRRMVEARDLIQARKLANHPWGAELSHAAHLGWVGGALSPSRTDWTVLKRQGIKRAFIVSDNDDAGNSAVPDISRALGIPTFALHFSRDWPASFDLGDDFPAKMFTDLGGERQYTGPSFRSCIRPATWATDMVQQKQAQQGQPPGRPIPVLRDAFKNMWAYVEEADLFVCKEMPEIRRSEPILNNHLASFSHVHQTSRLIVKAYTGQVMKLCYRPDAPDGVVIDRGAHAINLHVPGEVKPTPGDVTPWLEYLEYLFPNPKERHDASRWIATLIARPGVRMHFGLLLVTESQGIGKTTLGSAVLAPLLGIENVGWPGESDISNSQFNGWVAHKRLVFVNEIYSGHSWKAYNSLKSIVADKEITVNNKYERNYVIDNWAHIIACSNSTKALRIENDDRRWFYPTMTEKAWPRQKFADFRLWLVAGGLGKIKHWAEAFGDYVAAGERAPITPRKKELISMSRTESAAEAYSLAEAMTLREAPTAVTMKDIAAHIRASIHGKNWDTDHELRKAMVEAGCLVWKTRLRVSGQLQHIIMNQAAYDQIAAMEDAVEPKSEDEAKDLASEQSIAIRNFLVRTQDIYEEGM